MLISSLAPNQYVVNTGNGVYFQSYKSVVAFKDYDNSKVTLGENYRYSKTTMKYLCKFLNRGSIKEIDALLKDGVFTIDNHLKIKDS